MIDGTAVDKIVEVAQQALASEERIFEVVGVPMSRAALKDVTPLRPEPEPIHLTGLQPLADYLEFDLDGIKATSSEYVIHVVNENLVRVVSKPTGYHLRRHTIAQAGWEPAWKQSRLASWIPVEDAIIELQTLVEDSTERAAILKLLGNVRGEDVKTSEDDGVSQTVTTRAGAYMKTEGDVPNPVSIAPFRSFPEIEQPASPFVFRLKNMPPTGVCAKLTEADGGAWQHEAMERIRGWLAKNVPADFTVI